MSSYVMFLVFMGVGYIVGITALWIWTRNRMRKSLEDMGKPMCEHGYDPDDCPECRR
jgi:hypothetical protein